MLCMDRDAQLSRAARPPLPLPLPPRRPADPVAARFSIGAAACRRRGPRCWAAVSPRARSARAAARGGGDEGEGGGASTGGGGGHGEDSNEKKRQWLVSVRGRSEQTSGAKRRQPGLQLA